MVSADDRHSLYDPELNAVVLSGKPSFKRDGFRPDLIDPDIKEAAKGIKFVDAGSRQIWNPDRNNFAPRLGFAYRPGGNDRVVLRGGWGIFYDEITGSGGSKGSLTKNFPATVTQRFNASKSTPNVSLDDPYPTGFGGGGTIAVNSMDRNIRTPMVQHFNFGIYSANLLLDAEFIRRFALHILPKGFVRIRHYGMLSTYHKRVSLKNLKAILEPVRLKERPSILHRKCPKCLKGNLITLSVFTARGPPKYWLEKLDKSQKK